MFILGIVVRWDLVTFFVAIVETNAEVTKQTQKKIISWKHITEG
jgi:hypothetical protein